MGASCELFPKHTMEMYVKAFMHHEEAALARNSGLSVWIGKNDQLDCQHYKVVVSMGEKGDPRRVVRQFHPCFVTEEKANEWGRELKKRFVVEFKERGVPAEWFEEGKFN